MCESCMEKVSSIEHPRCLAQSRLVFGGPPHRPPHGRKARALPGGLASRTRTSSSSRSPYLPWWGRPRCVAGAAAATCFARSGRRCQRQRMASAAAAPGRFALYATSGERSRPACLSNTLVATRPATRLLLRFARSLHRMCWRERPLQRRQLCELRECVLSFCSLPCCPSAAGVFSSPFSPVFCVVLCSLEAFVRRSFDATQRKPHLGRDGLLQLG